MPFDVKNLMNSQSKNESSKENAYAFKIEILHIDQIEPSKLNFYSVNDVADLKASIELIGLQQNLVVRKKTGCLKYELTSGERRYTALKQLVSEGKEGFAHVPCKIVKSIDDIQAELQLIFANSTARKLTDYEHAHQAQRLKELLSGYKIKGRKRDAVAKLLQVSASQVARYDSINNNLSAELMAEFRAGNINVTTAFEASRLDDEHQAEILEEHKGGKPITPEKVKERREAVARPQTPEPKSEYDFDTSFPDPEAGEMILNCPFCGREPSITVDTRESGFVFLNCSENNCVSWRMSYLRGEYEYAKKKLVARWNRRWKP